MKLGKAFGAVAALEQEPLARGNLGQIGLERARLASENQRREIGQNAGDPF